MSTYYYGSGLTYLQYLQTKSFVSDVKGTQQKAAKAISLTVNKQTRDLIASQEALARENIRTMEAGFGQVAQVTEEGFEQLSWEIQGVGRGISELNASFHWGFSEMLTQMTRLNSAMSELVKLATTPIQTEASEYFMNARDALRRGLYPEALEEAEKAIAKHKLEWRFHSLVGTIRLGNVSGGLELLDLLKAEESFLLAARYARADQPEDAARAYLAASWAAYCQGKMGRSLDHAEEAVKIHPRFPEALFQAGKVYMALSEPDNAFPLLRKAIELDKCYALKAAADGDFQRNEAELREFIEVLRQEVSSQIRPEVEAVLVKYRFWLSQSADIREDPLVKSARFFVESGLPLWDLLAMREELLRLPAVLAERAAKIRFVSRIEQSGPIWEIEENYVEEVQPDAGFFRKLAGAKERTRIVEKRWNKESVLIRDATGAISTQIDLLPIPPARFEFPYPCTDGMSSLFVKITRPFLLASTPVTNAQYEAFFPRSESFAPSVPAVNLSWYDAIVYCNALSAAVGIEEAYAVSSLGVKFHGLQSSGFRLPTEAEWEYACFGEYRRDRNFNYFDDEELDELAWIASNSGGHIHEVALKQPNMFGLYDLLGNVSEWMFDSYFIYDKHYFTRYSQQEDPQGPDERSSEQSTTKSKVTRGGSYNDPDESQNAAPGKPMDPNVKLATLGFRVARTITAPSSH